MGPAGPAGSFIPLGRHPAAQSPPVGVTLTQVWQVEPCSLAHGAGEGLRCAGGEGHGRHPRKRCE